MDQLVQAAFTDRAGDPVGTPFVPAPWRGDLSVSDDRRSTSDARVRQAEAPAEEACAASKHLHLADVRMSQSCRWSARTAEGTGWNAEQGLVRCAEAGQESLGTNGRSTRLRSQR